MPPSKLRPPPAGLGPKEAWPQGRKQSAGGTSLEWIVTGWGISEAGTVGVVIPPQDGWSSCTSPRGKKGEPPPPHTHTPLYPEEKALAELPILSQSLSDQCGSQPETRQSE